MADSTPSFTKSTTGPRQSNLRWVVGVSMAMVAMAISALLFTDTERGLYDAKARLLAGVGEPDPRIVLVLIDENSVEGIETSEKRSTWSRSLYGSILEFCRQAEVIGFDVYFAGDHIHSKGDEIFSKRIETFARRGEVRSVTGLNMFPKKSGHHLEEPFLWSSLPGTEEDFPQAVEHSALVAPYGLLFSNRFARLGHVIYPPKEDGSIRSYAAIAKGAGKVFPSLSLASLLSTTNAPDSELELEGRTVRVGEESLTFDARGEFRFRHFDQVYKYCSFLDVLEAFYLYSDESLIAYRSETAESVMQGSRICREGDDVFSRRVHFPSPDFFEDKIVLVGSSAQGILTDLKPTAYSEVTPGVYIHAWAIDNMLNGEQIIDSPLWMDILLILLLALAPLLFVHSPGRMLLTGLLILLGYVAIGLLLAVSFMYFLPLAGPTIATLLSSAAMAGIAWGQEQEARSELQAMEAAKQEFTDYLVHDLKGQINAMGLSLSFIEGDIPRESNSTRVLSTLRTGMSRLLEQTNNLLDIRKIEEGKMKVTPRLCNLHELVRDVIREYSAAADWATLELHGDLDRDFDRPVQLDDGLFRRILGNLVWNAIQYAEKGTKVEIITRLVSPETFTVHVANRGKVIPQEQQAKLFQPFSSGEDPATSKNVRSVSTGLGLLFCQLASEAHGGGIELESPWENGDGVIVKLSFPVNSGVESKQLS